MLGLKNLFNKKEKIQNVDTFRKDYYEKNIIPEFNKYWNDEFVCEKLGLKSIAEGEVNIQSDISEKDLMKCDKILGEILLKLYNAALCVCTPIFSIFHLPHQIKSKSFCTIGKYSSL